MRISASAQSDTKPESLYNEYTKYNIKYEPVVQIEGIRVAKLWSNDHI